jgi:hypothetical protein
LGEWQQQGRNMQEQPLATWNSWQATKQVTVEFLFNGSLGDWLFLHWIIVFIRLGSCKVILRNSSASYNILTCML